MITFPLLVGGLAVIAWQVIGWTLRPVEQLRQARSGSARTRRISGPAGPERLPVPAAAGRDPGARGHPQRHAGPAGRA